MCSQLDSTGAAWDYLDFVNRPSRDIDPVSGLVLVVGETAGGLIRGGDNLLDGRSVGVSSARSFGKRVEGLSLGAGTCFYECGTACPNGAENLLGVGVALGSEQIGVDDFGEETSDGT